ncbi:unnamed protein product [Prorocentrum cordatum]|uniref:Uncharacterized protein n=1 Tax=Prorocentrum cordatum TaxID=2364126 RepID=A0ABN9VHH6_9DINO|nr:unnamed protein product [Polarella glacialis]
MGSSFQKPEALYRERCNLEQHQICQCHHMVQRPKDGTRPAVYQLHLFKKYSISFETRSRSAEFVGSSLITLVSIVSVAFRINICIYALSVAYVALVSRATVPCHCCFGSVVTKVSPRAGWMVHRLDVGTSLAVGYLGRCPPQPACPPCLACSLSCASLACPAAPPCPACLAAAFQAPAAAEPALAAAPPLQAGTACAACVEAPCVC